MAGALRSAAALAATAVLLGTLASGRVAAGAGDELYRARTIVTGQGEVNRAVGFAKALEAVLVKVSGDPRLIGDPRVASLARDAGSFVGGFSYRDLLAGIPVRDEQGTRDRPYELTVGFDPPKVDAALRSLGRGKWPAEARPRVAMILRIENGPSRYLLARDGEFGRDQRESLAAAAEAVGLPLVVPSAAALAAAGADPGADGANLEAAARAMAGGDAAAAAAAALAGELTWSERDLGWAARWRLAAGGRVVAWGAKSTSFDEAFRAAARGAVQVLSGHGEPGQAG